MPNAFLYLAPLHEQCSHQGGRKDNQATKDENLDKSPLHPVL